MVCYLRMLKKTVILSQAYKKLISAISHTKDILRISQPYLVHIIGLNKACLRNISNISQAYLRYLSSKSYLGHLLSIFQAYLTHILGITQRFKCLPVNDKISVNSFSFNIFLIYTEIFAAYAGSCLF